MNIAIAFSFDENFWRYAGVTITSLLVNSKDKCSYDIYCMVPDALPQQCRESLTELVGKYDSASKITFLSVKGAFDNAYTGGFTVLTYYRLLLPTLLPHLDKIIYADTDVIFSRDLSELWEVNLADFVIAGVKDCPKDDKLWAIVTKGVFSALNRNSYVNAGLLIMNLKALREGDFWDTWVELATKHTPYWWDQCILNLTLEGKKLFLPPKYNRLLISKEEAETALRVGFYTAEEYEEAVNAPVMIHYAGGIKPWNSRVTSIYKIWWDYAALTPFYKSFKTIRFPKPIANLICCFIPTVAWRRAFRKKHMYW